LNQGFRIAVRQATAMRREQFGAESVSNETKEFVHRMEAEIEFIEEDVFLEPVLRKVFGKIQECMY